MGSDSSTQAGKRQRWQGHISAWQSSGLSQAKYCERHGLSYSTFLYWRSQLKNALLDSQSISFVPVSVKTPSYSSALSIELDSGVCVRIDEAVDLQWLGRVVKALQASA